MIRTFQRPRRARRIALDCRCLAFLAMPGLCLTALSAAAVPAQLTIAAGGQSAYAIVVPDPDAQDRVLPAAELLQTAIEEAAGVKLPIHQESAVTGRTPAFYLGRTRAARKAGLPVDQIQGWAYLVKTVDADVFIAGADGEYDIRDQRAPVHLGTLKGVTAFLEEQWGVRFLVPGTFGRRVPRHDPLTVPTGLDTHGEQIFDYVIGRAPRSDRVFAVALNLFRSTPILKSYGGHSYYSAVPEKTYAETHPAYFALRGTARDASGNHLCIANPEVQNLMLREMEAQLDKGYQWVELAQTDGYQACQCDACRALHPEPAERLWIVHRKLAQQLQTRRPGKKVMIISYGPTATPPKTFTRFPDNVVIQLCAYTPPRLAAWEPFNVDKTVYIYNWGTYKLPGFGPTRTPRYVIEQVRRFRAHRVRGIYLCGGYDPGVGYGLNGPALYAFGKALTQPERDPDDVLEEYVNALFGEAAAPMRAFYRTLYGRLDAYCLFDIPNVDTGGIPSSMRTPEDYYCHVFPAHALNHMTTNLQRAAGMAKDERVKAALAMVEQELDYVGSIASVFQVYRAYRVKPNPGAFQLLAEAMETHTQVLDGMYDRNGKYVHTLPGGLPAQFAPISRRAAEMNGRTMGMRPPFNWDFVRLSETGILPGAAKPKRLTVQTIRGVTMDGRIDEGAWQRHVFAELGEIGLGESGNLTRFKVAYDDAAFYVAVACAFDDPAPLDRLASTGRDGNAWAQECIELVIDPFGEREKHCQLVFSPVPDATFDAQRGYIEDPLHPSFGKADMSWNGNWDYAARIDRESKVWTAEVRIPFTALETPPAAPGTVWTFNVCRAEWPIPYGADGYSQKTRYSTWSPNLESRSFHDRATFGELVFE